MALDFGLEWMKIILGFLGKMESEMDKRKWQLVNGGQTSLWYLMRRFRFSEGENVPTMLMHS